MNKFKYYFILIITCLSLFSCSKDDNSIEAEPLRDFQEQFTTDNTTIEEYLNSYYINVTNAPGQPEDQDVVFTKIPTGGSQPSIMSYLNSSTFPKLIKKTLRLHEIDYGIYYLVLREGTGEKPCNVDGVLSSYRGQYLYKTTVSEVTTLTSTQFEEVKYPQTFLNLYETIMGWSEVFPEFRTGDAPVLNADGTVTYNNFGAGVMFLPSGLGYYSSGSGSIPSYAPLVFSFKLYAIKRSDLDNDGIPSYLEDLNGDNYMRTFATGVANPDDFDGDGIPNYIDIDDDGDSYLTRSEITVNGVVTPFASIPDCSGNTTNASRIKKHLDKNCH
ncbi:FKBP-type peptidyl-prolyl cis-trans isomerase [Flavobacterium undicola]|uniref:FKBP-type peptidyl-prolyl cis-trans isomerase n=1 Tax=Flavobacterium undicola TaxID=1932779 RepID=UPI001376C20E|nr:FKBP-type peptidylprolyl isomerase [Flavobacterium undicola]MBA0884268.1 FKBP-type peptidylprolyl isomerase [Flavobacterium undicola]